jgi:hypothetical protein
MIRRKFLLALALGAVLGLGTNANAAFLTGTIGFNSDLTQVVLPAGQDINTGTLFSFSTVAGGPNTITTTAAATGSFAAVPVNTVIHTTQLDTTTVPNLTLTLGPDSFTANSIITDINVPGVRAIKLAGTIAGPGFTTTPGLFVLTFTQAGGPTTTISYSGTLAAVPEPSSIALMGIGSLGIAGLGWRRARRKGE